MPEPRGSVSPSISSSSSRSRESNGALDMDDPESTMATVAHFLEQLHTSMSSQSEKELITARLLAIVRAQKEARALIGSHSQAMPLFISILRSGTPVARVNVAATLSALCKEEDLRVKVLLGGCIPPLLTLLKSGSSEARKAAAEAIFEVSSGGLSDDHIGTKIFITEGVVPTLWDQLKQKLKQDRVVEGFVTGALRNLCGDKDGYWRATLEAGGVEIITGLLSSDNTSAQSNAASLLARLILAFGDSIPKVIDAGAVGALLHLLGRNNDISVRAGAADALEALSSKSTIAKKAVVDAGGIPILIGAVVAPSKECMQGETGHALQGHAVRALANICGGMSSLVLYLGELAQSPRLSAPVADIIGALAYSLMVYEGIEEKVFDPIQIEEILIILLKPRDNKLIQDRVLEALASLYGNAYFVNRLDYADAKRVLIGLTTMASIDAQEHLILSLSSLCCDGVGIWEALRKREGIQLLISLLGLSSEQHQEYAVALLAILTDQVDDSKWAITAAGGIPPLVQLLEAGSQKAREDAAHILWNLCCHSDDIRACVESAGAIPALLWLLRSGGPKGQEASSKALRKLIHVADSATINQLLALLLSDDSTGSKYHAITVLGHVLTMASHRDLVLRGAPANKGLRSLVEILNSSNEETQECAASVLADLFSTRQDICDSLATDEIVNPCMKLLTSKTQVIATQSARALGALSRPSKTNSPHKMSYISEGDVKPLIKMTQSSSMVSAETAVSALANLLSDPQIAEEALAEDIVSALMRVLDKGTLDGKKNASRALHQLLNHFPVADVLPDSSQCRFVVLTLADSLVVTDLQGSNSSDALEVLSLLARKKQNVHCCYPPGIALAEVPGSLDPLVQCLAIGLPPMQDKAIEILSRLCRDQPDILGVRLVEQHGCVASLAHRVMNSSSIEVRIGGVALLVCAAKQQRDKTMNALDASGLLENLIYTLVNMLKNQSNFNSLQLEVRASRNLTERKTISHLGEENDVPDPANILGGTVALWMLSIMSSSYAKSKLTVIEAGGVEVLSNKLASYAANPQGEYEDTENIWASSLLLAILFQEPSAVQSSATKLTIPSLVFLLKTHGIMEKYFAAQAIASLACIGGKGIQLAIANSGAVKGLVTLLGHVESDMPNLVALSKEFNLVQSPEQVVLEQLFEIEDVRIGATARKSIPLLVDLLRPMPDRPGAPPVAVRLLTRVAEGNEANKMAMAEAGALDALTKYLSLSPQDPTETSITELLGILYRNSDLLHHEVSLSSLNQLIAVLRLGSRNARFSAARTLQELFDAENIRDTEMARQAIQPLVDMLDIGSEREQQAALGALIKLTAGSVLKASSLIDAEGKPVENLYRILSFSSSLELKTNAAQLCYLLFGNSNIRAMPTAAEFIQPLVSLMTSYSDEAVESGVLALERLLEEEHYADVAATYEVVNLLVGFTSGSNYKLSEASISALVKLGKDRPQCKLDMIKAGIINNALEMLLIAPGPVCSKIADLLRILTNNDAALEKELWSTATINEEILRTIFVIFTNFRKLRMSEAATLCIPHLVGALKAGSEGAQESVLDTLCLLKESWSEMNEDIAKAQALIAAEAIPILQLLMKTCPPSFHERADSLLHCLPGCLTVTIKRGNNLKQTMGSTNAFCQLKIGNGPPKQTKVVNHSTCPEWKEGFSWAFDVPPKGQKLYILCKSKSTFGKTTLGRVTIQIDKVVTEGVYSGLFSLNHDSSKDASSRTLEIEIPPGASSPSKKSKSPPPPPPSCFADDLDAVKKPPSSAVFPIYGDVYPHGLYYVSMSIGDPPKPYFLDVDTGSDLTWLQCDAPCVSCSKVPHPLYRPRKNSLVPCKDPLCAALHASTHQNQECESLDQCDYEIQYADQWSSLGVLVSDAVALRLANTSLVHPQLAFGCGYDQQGAGVSAPSPTDGVLGLGTGEASIMSQLKAQGVIKNVLGHCLSRRGGGYLFFGDDLVPSYGVTWAPMSRITLRKSELLLRQAVFGYQRTACSLRHTYFTNQPYQAFLTALKNDLRKKPLKEAVEDPALPICWKGAKPFKSLLDVKKFFKSLVLNFVNGRKAAQMEIPPENYLIVTKHGNACLGILNGTQVGLKDLNIIGDISMQDVMVVYDNEKQQIGWARVNCDRLPNVDGVYGFDDGYSEPWFASILAEECPANFNVKEL
ncbi:uncharacterized protein A4U43_C09F6970 [Asparagus officinalis]|uniref:Aspartic proteinase Asp1 n=1 Tax=Asparagus officinalis TaxID=4686 RepID=A0A5P1EAP8_ASPOF|nr:uncharacterized protein A4U43_C09F6970 [Asparagus officinalis]